MSKFISFSSDITNISLPEEIQYPHIYTPHTLAKTAAFELQEYLKNQTDFEHDFGFNTTSKNGIGKMFGVLVVKNNNGSLGYLTAFSGKLANTAQHKHFVPPIFDILDENGFYRKTEEEINAVNAQIKILEKDAEYTKLNAFVQKHTKNHALLVLKEQETIKKRRQKRKRLGKIDNQLNINEEFFLREYEVYLHTKISIQQNFVTEHQKEIDTLKKNRKEKSAWVQQEVFKEYLFLNGLNETKSLLAIFKNTPQNIPGGTGDCCAPKLFQYAFLNNLKPIALAEFWWGKPLKTSVRKHGSFYPACNGKCKPLLAHMLKGLSVEDNPLIEKLRNPKNIEIIFEDDFLAVINKPHDLLSVSGKEIEDSVYSILKKKYPKATGPLLVHRLDMSTSGILLIAKNKDIHKLLQAQFINRTVQKKYVAILDGILLQKKGAIELPLRVDYAERPKQMVCYDRGKKATTQWETIAVKNNTTRVHLYPITGRTHQLRVHMAHYKGLNTPILGDELYGKQEKRLYLHAKYIQFTHPISLKKVSFSVDAPF